MSGGDELPNDILEAVRVLRELKDKPYMSRLDRENLNRAKLRIAFWACRTENIVASRENISYIIGPDAPAIMGAYDKYLEREDGRPSTDRRKRKDSTEFWGDV